MTTDMAKACTNIRSGRAALLATLLVSAAGVASAQAQAGYGDDPLRRVDAGYADTGPLATSSRQLPLDLRTPTGFEHVYRVPGSDGTLMRISGGLVATFPRSQYDQTADGTFPVIPAGTVFHLGGVPEAWDTASGGAPFGSATGGVSGGVFGPEATGLGPLVGRSAGRAFNYVDRLATPVPPIVPRVDDSAGPRSIWDDGFYRSMRLRALLATVTDDGADEPGGSD